MWSIFPEDAKYFAPSPASHMINWRVGKLAAMPQQLRAAGAPVADHVEEYDFGQFGCVMDPENNRIKLRELKTPF